MAAQVGELDLLLAVAKDCGIVLYYKKAMLSQGNRAMPL